jgi:hypothetical protein
VAVPAARTTQGDETMTPKIPVELAHAREQREAAYVMYGKAIDDGSPLDATERLYQAADAWDKVCQSLYDRWQKVGGTSDIESIEAAEQAALVYGDHPLNPDGTSTPEWFNRIEPIKF